MPDSPKTPLKTPYILTATLIPINICKGLTDKKCKITNIFKGPYGLTVRGEYIPPLLLLPEDRVKP